MFDELPKTPFRSWKRKQGYVVEVEDGGLLGFAAFKDLQVHLEEGAEAKVPLNIQDLWVVPKGATGDTDIGDAYGVGLEDGDKDSDDEDLDRVSEVAGISSSNFHNQLALSSPETQATSSASSNRASQLVFAYDVDEVVLQIMERGRMHEWTNVEFKTIRKKHGLSVRGAKGGLVERVKVHFQQYQLYQCTSCREFVISYATGDAIFGWSNAVSLYLMKNTLLLIMLYCARCQVGFGCYHCIHVGAGTNG